MSITYSRRVSGVGLSESWVRNNFVSQDQLPTISGNIASDVIQTVQNNLSTASGSHSLIELDDGSTITPDFKKGNNFIVTISGNRLLGFGSHPSAGQSGVIIIEQDSVGNRYIALDDGYHLAFGVSLLDQFKSPGSRTILSYFIVNNQNIIITDLQNQFGQIIDGILDIDSLTTWFDAAEGNTGTGIIQTWTSKYTDARQLTSGGQSTWAPYFVASGINGHPTLQFPNQHDGYSWCGLGLTEFYNDVVLQNAPRTIFIIVKNWNAGNNDGKCVIGIGSQGTQFSVTQHNGKYALQIGSTYIDSSFSASTDAAIIMISWDLSRARILVNAGYEGRADVAPLATTNQEFCIGNAVVQSTAPYVEIAECIVFGKSLLPSEEQYMWDYYSDKFAITLV